MPRSRVLSPRCWIWRRALGGDGCSGSVYPVLARLEEAEWIESSWEREERGERGPRRRFYRLVPDGPAAARALLAGVAGFMVAAIVIPLLVNEAGDLTRSLASCLLRWGARRIGRAEQAERCPRTASAVGWRTA